MPVFRLPAAAPARVGTRAPLLLLDSLSERHPACRGVEAKPFPTMLPAWGQVAESFLSRYDDTADRIAVFSQVFQPKQVRVPANVTDLDSNRGGSDFPGCGAELRPDRAEGGLQGWVD